MSIDGIISLPHKLILQIPCVDVISILTEKVSGELEMLERHLLILKQVVENEPIGILKLAEETDIPSHKVRYSLRVLEQEGLIKASAPGAVTTEDTEPFLDGLDAMIENLARRAGDLKKIKIAR
jgi:predicted transcriptional regulator